MPYQSNHDLPDSVRHVLPEHAQSIYRKAFNSAFEQYRDPKARRFADESGEQVACKVAWSAVKREYEKDESNGKWHKK